MSRHHVSLELSSFTVQHNTSQKGPLLREEWGGGLSCVTIQLTPQAQTTLLSLVPRLPPIPHT